jgi:hypothetical protein
VDAWEEAAIKQVRRFSIITLLHAASAAALRQKLVLHILQHQHGKFGAQGFPFL